MDFVAFDLKARLTLAGARNTTRRCAGKSRAAQQAKL